MSTMLRWTEAQLAAHRARMAGAKAAPIPTIHEAKANKYGARKTEVAGVAFDSKAEARRWQVLQAMERAGEIADLKRQVPFELVPKQQKADGSAVRAVTYVADFTYRQGERLVVEDVKGMRTPEYKLKAKLMLWRHAIEIHEVSR